MSNNRLAQFAQLYPLRVPDGTGQEAEPVGYVILPGAPLEHPDFSKHGITFRRMAYRFARIALDPF